MVQYYPGPDEVEIQYIYAGLTHLMRLNCTVVGTPAMGAAFSDISVLQRAGTNDFLDVMLDDLMFVILPLYSADTEFVSATLWHYTPDTFDRNYVSTQPIGQAGTNVGVVIAATQHVYTYRTLGGSRMRLNLIEPVGDNTNVYPQSALTSVRQDFAEYFLSPECWVHARDNTFAGVGLRMLEGQNEAIFRKRYRS